MTIKEFHIFKPGVHTTMGGESLQFTQQELQETAAAFSEAVRPAPLVLGHPSHDGPAMGWVKGLTASAMGLFATAEFGESLVAEVKAKRYPHVSAAFLPKDDPRNPTPGRWYLRHVGFLGAIAPAVKGLEPVTFAEFSWGAEVVSTPAISITRELEVAFAEVQVSAGHGKESERQVLHKMMQLLMKRTPGMSASAAASTAYREIEAYKARRAKDSGMDADRVAFHEAILDYQASAPGMSYAAAANHLFSRR